MVTCEDAYIHLPISHMVWAAVDVDNIPFLEVTILIHATATVPPSVRVAEMLAMIVRHSISTFCWGGMG